MLQLTYYYLTCFFLRASRATESLLLHMKMSKKRLQKKDSTSKSFAANSNRNDPDVAERDKHSSESSVNDCKRDQDVDDSDMASKEAAKLVFEASDNDLAELLRCEHVDM